MSSEEEGLQGPAPPSGRAACGDGNAVEAVVAVEVATVGGMATSPHQDDLEDEEEDGEDEEEHKLKDVAWSAAITTAVQNEPCPETVLDALRSMAAVPTVINLHIDIGVVQGLIESKRSGMRDKLRQLGCPPEFAVEDALTIWIYTLEQPAVYRAVNRALRARLDASGQMSEAVKACLPFIKRLDWALDQAPTQFQYTGRCFRGDKWVWLSPQQHDPAGFFEHGFEFSWHEFKSASREMDIVYNEKFCGRRGPRTIFTIEGVYGVLIREFSEFAVEDEVLFPINTMFRVAHCQKRMRSQDLAQNATSGLPDEVHLQQPMAQVLPMEGILEVRRANIDYNAMLGRGSFAQVYRGTYRFRGHSQTRAIALKLFDNSLNIDARMKERFVAEAKIGSTLRHDNLIALFGVLCIPDRGWALALELAAGGALDHALRAGGFISWEVRLRWLQEIAQGLASLHSEPNAIVHRDLKAANVLLSSTKLSIAVAKVADFGVAEVMMTEVQSRRSAGSVGTLAWKAPETFIGEYTTSSDVFGFGVTAFEVITKQLPWDRLSEPEIMAKASERFRPQQSLLDRYGISVQEQRENWMQDNPLDGRRPDLRGHADDSCPDQLLDLVERCWADETHYRPAVSLISQILAEIAGELTGTNSIITVFDNPLSRISNSSAVFDHEGEHEKELDTRVAVPRNLRCTPRKTCGCVIVAVLVLIVLAVAVSHASQHTYLRSEFCLDFDCNTFGRRRNGTELHGLKCSSPSCSSAECCWEYPSCQGFDCSKSANLLAENAHEKRCSDAKCLDRECCTVVPPALGSRCAPGWTGITTSSCERGIPYCEWHVDPCVHGSCLSIDRNQYKCECLHGWNGSRCDKGIPFCLWNRNPCHHGGTCSSSGHNDYSCKHCDAGWRGRDCDEGTPYCDWNSNPCPNGGRCVSNGRDAYTCDCPQGFSGEPRCDEPMQYCDWHSPCLNGGECQSNGHATFKCNCTRGWTGDKCQFGCVGVDCGGYGQCINTTGLCECAIGYTGDSCKEYEWWVYLGYVALAFTWVGFCACICRCTKKTRPRACTLCAVTVAAFSVWGLATWSLVGGYCLYNENPCLNYGTCVDTVSYGQSLGSDRFEFQCDCTSWMSRGTDFGGDICEIEGEWCDGVDCGGYGQCVNATGLCACVDGHAGDRCEDYEWWVYLGYASVTIVWLCHVWHRYIHKCELFIVTGAALVAVGFATRWLIGGYCVHNDNPCLHSGACVGVASHSQRWGSDRFEFECECTGGWTGEVCESEKGWCDLHPNPCAHGGACVSRGKSHYTCACTDCWRGDSCGLGCEHGGICLSDGNCDCEFRSEGWTGERCEIEIGWCEWHPEAATSCSGDSVCVSCGRNEHHCDCRTEGWQGDSCNEPTPYCEWHRNP
eukprot:COSAG02_NODE_4982_length_4751_cov_8.305245_2_plen_1387_part_01